MGTEPAGCGVPAGPPEHDDLVGGGGVKLMQLWRVPNTPRATVPRTAPSRSSRSCWRARADTGEADGSAMRPRGDREVPPGDGPAGRFATRSDRRSGGPRYDGGCGVNGEQHGVAVLRGMGRGESRGTVRRKVGPSSRRAIRGSTGASGSGGCTAGEGSRTAGAVLRAYGRDLGREGRAAGTAGRDKRRGERIGEAIGLAGGEQDGCWPDGVGRTDLRE